MILAQPAAVPEHRRHHRNHRSQTTIWLGRRTYLPVLREYLPVPRQVSLPDMATVPGAKAGTSATGTTDQTGGRFAE